MLKNYQIFGYNYCFRSKNLQTILINELIYKYFSGLTDNIDFNEIKYRVNYVTSFIKVLKKDSNVCWDYFNAMAKILK